MNRTSNYTLEGIHNTSERLTWVSYNILIILSSLFGDSIILIATIKYNAVKLHRIIVVMIQHLAVSDLLMSLFKILPMTVTLVTDRWVLGEFLCVVNPLVGWLCNPVTIFLTCLLATSKLLIIRRPLRALCWTRMSAHVACFTVWAICFLNPVQLMNFMVLAQKGGDGAYLKFLVYECALDRDSIEVPSWLKSWCYLIYGCVTFLVMIATCVLTSILMLLFARKAAKRQGRKLHWQGVMTIAMTATLFIISYFPFFVVKLTTQMFSIAYRISTERVVHFLPHINVTANFFIYCTTVRSFRNFLLSLIGVTRKTEGAHSERSKKAFSSLATRTSTH